MRRALVLTSEAARHPFRAALPPHVLGEEQAFDPRRRMIAVTRAEEQPLRQPKRKAWLTLQDVKDFLMAYCACLVCVTAFIS